MRRMFSKNQVKEIGVEGVKEAPSGTINKALGLNSSGELVKGTISGGTQLYRHDITFEIEDETTINCIVISTFAGFYGEQELSDSIQVGYNGVIAIFNVDDYKLCVSIYSDGGPLTIIDYSGSETSTEGDLVDTNDTKAPL